jgi:hypothetical protein
MRLKTLIEKRMLPKMLVEKRSWQVCCHQGWTFVLWVLSPSKGVSNQKRSTETGELCGTNGSLSLYKIFSTDSNVYSTKWWFYNIT